MLAEGRQTFRFDTFGDEAFWGGTLRLHEVVAQLTPVQALSLGLKVDADALPPNVLAALRNGQVNLEDPVVTKVLLQHNAVVGVQGFFSGSSLSSVGITCALCHSTVNNSVAPGVGSRLDGWANRDLNVGAIIASAPNLAALAGVLGVPVEAARAVLQTWGPGKFDAELLLDGRVQGPNGPAATLLPPAFGLAGVNQHTWTGGWGNVTYWNAFVANLEMGGQGTFVDPRLNNPTKYPVATANGFYNVRHTADRVTPKLGALHFYQLAIPAPTPPRGSFNAAAAARGALVFNSASCSRCHVPPLYTEPGYNTHTAAEIGIDGFQASRSPDERYRTSPLKGLWTHTQGGFYHDGRFATLTDVVAHYNTAYNLNLTAAQVSDLVEFLKSL
jgi:cytochrome c5